MNSENRLLEIDELAELTGFQPATLRKKMRAKMSGKDVDIFPFAKVGRKYFANLTDVRKWYEKKYKEAGFDDFTLITGE